MHGDDEGLEIKLEASRSNPQQFSSIQSALKSKDFESLNLKIGEGFYPKRFQRAVLKAVYLIMWHEYGLKYCTNTEVQKIREYVTGVSKEPFGKLIGDASSHGVEENYTIETAEKFFLVVIKFLPDGLPPYILSVVMPPHDCNVSFLTILHDLN